MCSLNLWAISGLPFFIMAQIGPQLAERGSASIPWLQLAPWIGLIITLLCIAWRGGALGRTAEKAIKEERLSEELSKVYDHCRTERGRAGKAANVRYQGCQQERKELAREVGKLRETTARLDERIKSAGGVLDRFDEAIAKASEVVLAANRIIMADQERQLREKKEAGG